MDHLQHQAHFINFLRYEKHLKELFEHQLIWKKYPLSYRDLNSCTQKAACFLLERFINIYNRIAADGIMNLNLNKAEILAKGKKKKKVVKNKKKAENTQVQECMEELENEIAEDDEPIIPCVIGKTELDDLLQKIKGLK
ncbi:43367_t:CDS:2 [Gigaspora margarita]|uniref:43367_t:CDS:1 n=1 Tax=Gigaspora margarita TaxID=4874 RepID=A0ABN7UDH6_GIGMA|nr:43367_t:CDS:2 [Gigaspora margarita]